MTLRTAACLLLSCTATGILLGSPVPLLAQGVTEGLVRHLDAGKLSSLEVDSDGADTRWEDLSGGGHHAEQIVAWLDQPRGMTRLEALAERLARRGQAAVRVLRAVNALPDGNAGLATAHLLRLLAERNALTDEPAELAVDLFAHPDPFVRGLAEWAVAMKVGGENNAQEARWPGSRPPAWFKTWSCLPPESRIQADWVRQAVSAELCHSAAALAESVAEMVRRAERMRQAFQVGADAAEQQSMADALNLLRSTHQQLVDAAQTDPVDRTALHALWIAARGYLRTVVMANPCLDFDRIVLVEQFAPHTVRNITRSYAWKHKPGGDICVLEDWKSTSTARRVLRGRLGPGYVWGLDLSWDADELVFAYAEQPNWPPAVNTADSTTEGRHVYELRQQHEPLHLFQCAVDGSQLRQLTDDPYWSDFEPTYCPDGQVVFSSDRCGRSAECGNVTYDHTNPNLYIIDPAGGTPRQLTDNKDIDRYPHALDDGRIAYTHWEYQERHFMEVHAVWTVRPDGTMSDTLFKHHMTAPCGLRDTRSIPGSAKLVSIATGHHTFAYGPVVILNPAVGLNDPAGLHIVTPGVRPQEGPMAGSPVPEGGVGDHGGLYQTPWALAEDCFLVAYADHRPHCTAPAGVDSNGFGLYLIDVYGNRELIHRNPLHSCAHPIPLRPRPRPLRVASLNPASSADSAPSDPSDDGSQAGSVERTANSAERCRTATASTRAADTATCFVSDVYDGIQGVSRGTIKYIRVAQHVGWPFDPERGAMDYIPGVAGTKQLGFESWSPVRIIGDVPVADDGSARFQVPADTAIYFQALDGRHMEIVRMRSMVSLKVGEERGCRGCHESQGRAPMPARDLPQALMGPPRVPTPPPWGGDRLLGYEWLVQPILDRHCVRCHGGEETQSRLELTGARAEDGFLQSYRTIFGRSRGSDQPSHSILVSCSDRFSNAQVTQPRQFGSHRSRLINVLLDDELHRHEVALEPTEWYSLVAWVDANAPYFDAFLNKRPLDGGQPRREIVPRLTAIRPASRP